LIAQTDEFPPDRAMIKALVDAGGETHYNDWFKRANNYCKISRDKFNRQREKFLLVNKVASRSVFEGRLEKVMYRLVESPLDEMILERIENELAKLEPTNASLRNATKKEAKFIVSQYTERIHFYLRLFTFFQIFEPYTSKAIPDTVKLEIERLTPLLIKRAHDVVQWLNAIDHDAAGEIFDARYQTVMIDTFKISLEESELGKNPFAPSEPLMPATQAVIKKKYHVPKGNDIDAILRRVKRKRKKRR
jgi:hypothetical protein